MEGNTMGGGGGVFVLLAGFVMGSEKSAGSFLKFIFNWSIIALVSTKYQYESATELQTLPPCAVLSEGKRDETGSCV